MPKFTNLEGQTLAYGNQEAYTLEDEKAFILSLEKQVRAVDPQSETHVSSLKKNLNQIGQILQLPALAEDGTWDDDTAAFVEYFVTYADLFRNYGITDHIKARELQNMTASSEQVFTENEYPPTMDEMKALEVDIGKLYEDEGVA